MPESKTSSRLKRHKRLRRKVIGTAERPRLQIQRSLHHLYAILVDDAKGHTLASSSTREKAIGEQAAGLAARLEAARKEVASLRAANGSSVAYWDSSNEGGMKS